MKLFVTKNHMNSYRPVIVIIGSSCRWLERILFQIFQVENEPKWTDNHPISSRRCHVISNHILWILCSHFTPVASLFINT